MLSDMPFVFCWKLSINQKRLEKKLKSLSWATRIRTWKMLESESSAVPFGDSPLPQQMVLYINARNNASVFFEKNEKKLNDNLRYILEINKGLLWYVKRSIKLLAKIEGVKIYVFI